MRLYQKINNKVQYLMGEALQPYNRRIILTESGDFTPQVTTWARVTCIGGGGAGGTCSQINAKEGCGGKGGGDTSFGEIKARGGGGGGGGRQIGGSGGGGAGEIVTDFIKLESGVPIPAIIGAGGLISTTSAAQPTGWLHGANAHSFQGNYQAATGGQGASNGDAGQLNSSESTYIIGNGGNGGTNGTAYGGGGAGGAGYWVHGTISGILALGYSGIPGGNGAYSKNDALGWGGNGGPGAIFIDFFDPSRLE